jgi:LacI family transcriptional regulator
MRSTTIRDVARHAGVSIATVSRVMRDSQTVRPDTRDRVLAAAHELEYTPSQLGRQLAERRHAANGIVFPDLSGPYFAEVVLGYEAVAAELRRSVLILSTHGRTDAEAAVREMAGRCDGLVILGRTVSDAVIESLADRGSRLVLVARPPIGSVDSVNTENHASAVALTEHLLNGGARCLCFVGDPAGSPDVAERWQGVQDAVTAHADDGGGKGEEEQATLDRVSGDEYDETAGAEIAAAALAWDRLPDAFVCANDELALGLIGGLRAAGVDVPGAVRVTGWDDVMAARYAGLTTVRQPMRQIGATAARLLDELILGDRTEPRHELLPTELVLRNSSTPHRKEP